MYEILYLLASITIGVTACVLAAWGATYVYRSTLGRVSGVAGAPSQDERAPTHGEESSEEPRHRDAA